MISTFQTSVQKTLKIIIVLFIAVIVYLTLFGCYNLSKKKKPNILFILSDDHANSAIGAYKDFLSSVVKTPNIDRIAHEGIIFINCFVTNAVCEPSRASILTGKYSHLHGVVSNQPLDSINLQTFPQLLRDNGYETAVIGKWHLQTKPVGFDYWNILPGQGSYYNPTTIEMGQKVEHQGHVTNIIANQVLSWLNNRNKEKPFFLMWNPKTPHRPWKPDTAYLDMYDNINIPEPKTLFDDYETRCRAAKEQKMSISNDFHLTLDLKIFPPDPNDKKDQKWWEHFLDSINEMQTDKWISAYGPRNEAFRNANLTGKDLTRYKYQRFIKDYLRCIAFLDENIGRVLDYLDKEGLTKNTIVIYSSDQGFFLGQHGWFDKRFMYEESINMPLLVRFPGEINPGSVNKDIVINLDFAPTILEYAGIKKPKDMQGRSIRPLLKGKTPRDWRKSMYYHYYEYPGTHMVKRHYGIRTKDYKLIHFYYDIDCWELYDLRNAPNEINNLYDNPNYEEVKKQLKIELEDLQKEYGDSDSLAKHYIEKYPGR